MKGLSRWVTRSALLSAFIILLLVTARAQGKQAVVILQSPGQTPGGAASACDGAAEINYQIIYDLKLNGKDDLRVMPGATFTVPVTRRDYEVMKKAKIRDLVSLAWEGETLQAVTAGFAAPVAALPDNRRPDGMAAPPLSTFYEVMVSGEAREGKQKRPLTFPLRQVRRLYLMAEGAAVSDALFNYAAAEKSMPVWEAFLKKTNNYRLGDASRLMREALLGCAQAELEKFGGGDYPAAERARQRVERAAAVRDDEQTRGLQTRIGQAKAVVQNARNQMDQLIRASRWDDAIAAAEPIKKYFGSWPEMREMHQAALKQSHTYHLFEGEKALQSKQLRPALDHCTTAWARVREGVREGGRAQACVCQARELIALGSSQTLRQQKRPGEAKEVLEKQIADSDCRGDGQLDAELKLAKCEYAQQLLAEARQLIAVPQARTAAATLKVLTPQNKGDFRAARAKLLLAVELCGNDAARGLLTAAHQRLSAYCLNEARQALARGAVGTAYVYLQSATIYTPPDATVANLKQQAREQFQAATTISVGAVFANHAGGAADLLNELSAELGEAAKEAGLVRLLILERAPAGATLRAIQNGRPPAAPAIIFHGELLSASVNRQDLPRRVVSAYWVDNPQYQRADSYYAEAKAVYENCKHAYGKPQCGPQEAEVNRLDGIRKSYPKKIEQEYYYREVAIRVEGALKLSFRSTDSVSHSAGAAETLGDAISAQCVERSGVHPDEKGFGVRDTICDLKSEPAYLAQLGATVRREARSRAVQQLRALPHLYYQRAQTAARAGSRTQAVEDYLRFIFLGHHQNTREAEEARKYVESFDAELKTDGALQ